MAGARFQDEPSVNDATAAAPEEQKDELEQDDSSLHYDEYYSFDPYAPTREVHGPVNILACLFPWMKPVHEQEENLIAKDSNGELEWLQVDLEPPKQREELAPESKEECPLNSPPSLQQGNVNSTPIQGILKKPQTNRLDHATSRRALFNTLYDQNNTTNDSASKCQVHFASMARVVLIEPHGHFTTREKENTWWKRSDYSDFKTTSRFVTRAMLQTGSEVWLTTNPSWGHGPKLPQAEEKQDEDVSNTFPDDKWWCRFGHSRRGLEHIVSPEEGKERQRNVRQSIKAVLREQSRQKQTPLEPGMDLERIRTVYRRCSSWARELCLAAGASDAAAVRSNFARGGYNGRDHYLVERQQGNPFHPLDATIPNFMMNKAPQPQQQYQGDAATWLLTTTLTEAIHDAPMAGTLESLSKKAVGFGTDHLDMSAALSGMGAVVA